MKSVAQRNSLGRRAFLVNGAVVLSSAVMGHDKLFARDQELLRIGLVTDLHYADKDSAGSRHYRQTLEKFAEAATQFERDRIAFLVELGDFIDAADSVDVEQAYLKRINQEFSAACKDRHYVLGNHCVDTLRKDEFLGQVGQQGSYYSFDRQGFHFIVLDSCFRSDGEPYGRKNFQWTDANIPAAELDWLSADLKASDKPTVVFAHQRLDVSDNHGVRNGAAVRNILESSGRILAVLQGHSHQNDLKMINNIHYCTLVAMVEGSGATNNGYSIMDLDPQGNIRLNGFRNQLNRDWQRA